LVEYITSGYVGHTAATNNTGSGFLIWSGSGFGPLINNYTDYPEDYNGVGLELHAGGLESGSLKFRTHPEPILDIRTPNFFLGSLSSGNYISGSNGNIEIAGDAIDINTANFFLGNDDAHISGSEGTIVMYASPLGSITISGSGVSLNTETFFLGNTDAFMSGSNGNIRIASTEGNIDITSQGTGKINISGSNIDLLTPTFLLGIQAPEQGTDYPTIVPAISSIAFGPATVAPWIDPGNAPGGNYLTQYAKALTGLNQVTEYLIFTGFDFTALPTDEDILGIFAKVNCASYITGNHPARTYDVEVKLLKDYNNQLSWTNSTNEALSTRWDKNINLVAAQQAGASGNTISTIFESATGQLGFTDIVDVVSVTSTDGAYVTWTSGSTPGTNDWTDSLHSYYVGLGNPTFDNYGQHTNDILFEDFGFTIPPTAVISGVEIELLTKIDSLGGSYSFNGSQMYAMIRDIEFVKTGGFGSIGRFENRRTDSAAVGQVRWPTDLWQGNTGQMSNNGDNGTQITDDVEYLDQNDINGGWKRLRLDGSTVISDAYTNNPSNPSDSNFRMTNAQYNEWTPDTINNNFRIRLDLELAIDDNNGTQTITSVPYQTTAGITQHVKEFAVTVHYYTPSIGPGSQRRYGELSNGQWGQNWTVADLNGSNFAFAISATHNWNPSDPVQVGDAYEARLWDVQLEVITNKSGFVSGSSGKVEIGGSNVQLSGRTTITGSLIRVDTPNFKVNPANNTVTANKLTSTATTLIEGLSVGRLWLGSPSGNGLIGNFSTNYGIPEAGEWENTLDYISEFTGPHDSNGLIIDLGGLENNQIGQAGQTANHVIISTPLTAANGTGGLPNWSSYISTNPLGTLAPGMKIYGIRYPESALSHTQEVIIENHSGEPIHFKSNIGFGFPAGVLGSYDITPWTIGPVLPSRAGTTAGFTEDIEDVVETAGNTGGSLEIERWQPKAPYYQAGNGLNPWPYPTYKNNPHWQAFNWFGNGTEYVLQDGYAVKFVRTAYMWKIIDYNIRVL
jgi:hypothetical protein